MSHAKTISELQSLSDEKLVEQHDALAANTVVGISYYLEELARRRGDKQARLMIRLTWIIAILTAINVVAVIADLAG
jgi:hypothetical protein